MKRIVIVISIVLLLTVPSHADEPTSTSELGTFLIPDKANTVWLWDTPGVNHETGDVLPDGRYRVLQEQDAWSQIEFAGRTPWVFTGKDSGLREETVGGTPVPSSTLGPTATPTPNANMIQMGQTFDVAGFTFVVKDVYRNKAVYEWGDQAIIAKGHFAIARFEVTSHVPYTVDFTDLVRVIFTDAPGNVYDASYQPLTVARDAQLAAPRLFGNGTTVWEEMQPTYVNFPMIHTEDVPDSVGELYLEFINRATTSGHWVYLQPLKSESPPHYEGRFIDAPERK